MAQGRRTAEWDRLAGLLCFLHNSFAEKNDFKAPDDFNPYRQAAKQAVKQAAKPPEKVKLRQIKGALFDDDGKFRLGGRKQCQM